MNGRQVELLKFLSKQIDWTKGNVLANHLGVSVRTVRNDIQMINTHFSKEQKELITSSKQNGYMLSEKQFANILIQQQYSLVPSNADERITYILKKLLYSSETINLFDVADELFVSESTIEKDIQRIKLQYLIDLELERQDNQVLLLGNEKSKRSLLVRVLLNEAKGNIFDTVLYSKFFNKVNLQDIKEILLKIIHPYEIHLTDMAIMNIVLHLAIITDKTILNEHPISISEFSVQYDEEDFMMANEISDAISQLYDIAFPQPEINYMALLIASKKTLHYKSRLRNEIEKNTNIFYLNLTKQLLTSIYEKFLIDFRKDDELFVGLCMHIKELHNRVNRGGTLRNPILEETKKTFPLIYEMAKFVGNQFGKLVNQELSEDEFGLIALHLCASLERTASNNTNKKKVAIICPTGFASSQLIKAKLQKYADYIEEIGFFSLNEMEQLPLFKPDLVLTTIDMEINIPCRILLVSPFITDNQEKQLSDFFLDKSENMKESKKYFKESLFFNHLDFSTPDQVIEFLCKQLYKQHYVPVDYVHYIKKREAISPTSFGNLLALPHPSDKVASQTIISVGILEKPIQWGMQQVQLILLFALANDGKELHDHLFRDLISLLEKPSKMKNIIRANYFTQFLEELSK
ncbi:BglG family transcription antiterminator [Lysinibacillus piscis]|uniref:Transcriptional antiterminator n=1 Tax=Lysinibacillus piscis TaxID=2518931 RepID=A0ABQ5NL96_9BACI|nr:BglG family transcription antiterminator [Lysinibacillus sp. KH24]GLC89078.1 transcriptional antiterminator [Lysinibacillus sp. KH24]